jgi:hypothetical protein
MVRGFPVFLDSLGKYQDVIQVNYHNSFCNKFLEDVVHHGLEGGWTVSETKEHHQGLEQAPVGMESRFPLIPFLHPDIVETPPDSQFGEVSGPSKLGDEF